MRRALTLLVILFGLLVADGGPALGHPFGPPPVARLDANGREVTIDWAAAEDDYTILGGALGVFQAKQTFVYDAEGQTVAGPPPTSQQLSQLANSAQLQSYVAEHISVRQEGADCPVQVDASQLAADGVELVATCPRAVTELEVGITLLQDLHPAYRTVGLIGDAGAKTLFTEAEPVRRLTFANADPGPFGSGWRTASLVLVALAMIGAVAAGVLSRRRASAGDPAR